MPFAPDRPELTRADWILCVLAAAAIVFLTGVIVALGADDY
jgi:hypothetical protein